MSVYDGGTTQEKLTMSTKVECPECIKEFRGQGGLDWHMQRSGHRRPGVRPDAQLKNPVSRDLEAAVFGTLDSLEYQVVEWLMEETPRVPKALVNRLHILAESLESI